MCVVRVTCVSVKSLLCEYKKVCCKSYVCQCHVLVGNIICLYCVQKMQVVKFVGTKKKRKEVPSLSQVSNFGPVLKVFYGQLTNPPFFCAKECCKSGMCQSHVFPLRGQECVL